MVDIRFNNQDTEVVFWKRLWHETEVVLAKCYNFRVDMESQEITATIYMTDRRALFHFISSSFRNFSEGVEEAARRDSFYTKLDLIYNHYLSYASGMAQSIVPHYGILYQHQKEVIARAFYRKDIFLAMDMGTGKTLTSASMSIAYKSQRVFIGCPAIAKWNWYKDLRKFGFNELEFTILDSRKKYMVKAFVEKYIICNYDIVDKFYDHLLSKPIDLIILDEAHNLKNHTSARSKRIAKLIERNPQARIIFLSGTPIKNRVDDVFNYLKLIGSELGLNHKKFLDMYTLRTSGRGGERVTGGKNLQELHNKLANFMIRITKEECLDLPPKIFMRYTFELDDYQEEYNKVLIEMAKEKSIQTLLSNIHTLNILTSKAKKNGIIELAEQIIESGKKVVIFGGYKEPLNDLAEYFGDRCVKVDGSVPSYVRSELADKFNDDPNVWVFLGNYTAAGVAINLVSASDIIIQSFPLTPAELEQGIDRLYRIGQKLSVNVHFTFCQGSVDEHLHDLLSDKLSDINAVIDTGKEVVEREDIREILIKKLLNRDDIDFNYFKKNKDTVPEAGELAVDEPKVEGGVEKVSDGVENMAGSIGVLEESSSEVGVKIAGHSDSFGVRDSRIEETVNDSGASPAVPKIQPTAKQLEYRAKAIEEQPWLAPNDLTKPQYHLIVHGESDVMLICGDGELRYHLEGGCEQMFSHHNPTAVITHGRHQNLILRYNFDESFGQNNPPVETKIVAPPNFIKV